MGGCAVIFEARTITIGDERSIVTLDYERVDDDGAVIWVDWSLYSVANIGGDPVAFVGDDGPTWDFMKASLRASGHVKWDGCHEFTVEDYHGCEPADLDKFLQTITAATREAAKLLTRSECDWKKK